MTIERTMRHDEGPVTLAGRSPSEAGPSVITTHLARQPADFTDVRATNLAVVLGYVRAHAPCSRADVAGSTGLNKATVSSLVSELIGRRLLRETGLTERRIGRPATMIVLDGSPYAAVGVSITADEVCMVAVDLAGEQLLSWRRAFTGGPPAKALASVATHAKRALTRLRDDGRQVLGLTVGVAGLVDADGVVRVASNLGWHDVAVRDILVRALGDPGFPIVIDNNANLAVLAEHRYGPYAGCSDVVLVTSGTGLGAGIVAGGRLLRGGAGYAGEIGHLALAPDGPLCSCGRHGCFEETAGVAALVRRLGSGAQGDELEIEVEAVIRRARAQEPTVLAALRDVGRHVGFGVSLLANLLNPQVVILGGYYVSLAPWIIPVAQEVLAKAAVAPNAGGVQIVASALGHDAAAAGGAARVLELVDAGHLPVPAE